MPVWKYPVHLVAYGFSEYYEPAFDRTLYWLPYGLVLGLGRMMPPEAAMRCVVLLGLAWLWSTRVTSWLRPRAQSS